MCELDATLDDSNIDNVKETEEDIVSKFVSLLAASSPSRQQTILRDVNKQLEDRVANGISLLHLNKQNSIGVFLFCRTQHAVDRLDELVKKKEINSILEYIFTILANIGKTIGVREVFLAPQASKCNKIFKGKSVEGFVQDVYCAILDSLLRSAGLTTLVMGIRLDNW